MIMSGYDIFGFHAARENDKPDVPFEGAVRVTRTTSRDSVDSDGRSPSVCDFYRGSSAASERSDVSDPNSELSVHASAAPVSKGKSNGERKSKPDSGSLLDISLPTMVSLSSADTAPLTPLVHAGLAAQHADDPDGDNGGDNDDDDDEDLQSDASAMSVTDLSAFDRSRAAPPERNDASEEQNSSEAGSSSGLPKPTKSILKKVSSYRRPSTSTNGGRMAGSRTAASAGSSSDAIHRMNGGHNNAAVSPNASRQASGWQTTGDNSGFYLPTDVMQNLDFSEAEAARAAAPNTSRSAPSQPTRARAGSTSAWTATRARTDSILRRQSRPTAAADQQQRRLSMNVTPLSSTESSSNKRPMQAPDYVEVDDDVPFEDDFHDDVMDSPTEPCLDLHPQQVQPTQQPVELPQQLTGTAASHATNSVPAARPAHRERSFYDQQAMYSRQMQAMGMGAPFMLGGLSGEHDEEDEDEDSQRMQGGFGNMMMMMPAGAHAAQAAPRAVNSQASLNGDLNRAMSSHPAPLYNTQGKTNDFGSNASQMVDYSLYNF